MLTFEPLASYLFQSEITDDNCVSIQQLVCSYVSVDDLYLPMPV